MQQNECHTIGEQVKEAEKSAVFRFNAISEDIKDLAKYIEFIHSENTIGPGSDELRYKMIELNNDYRKITESFNRAINLTNNILSYHIDKLEQVTQL